MTPAWWVEAGVVILLTAILNWTPVWRRRNLWFGVTVDSEFPESQEAQRVLSRYRIAVVLLATAALALMPLHLVLIGPALLTIGATLAYSWARSQTLPFASRKPHVRSASLLASPESFPGGWWFASAPLMLVAITAAILYTRGEAQSWPLLAHTLLPWAILTGSAAGILYGSPRGRVASAVELESQFRRVSILILLLCAWGAVLVNCATALHWTTPYLSLILLSPMLYLVRLIRIRRGTSGGDGTPDSCWKAGIFYYNPADPALFVEKRFGVGYTFNFANRIVWILGALLAAFLGLMLTTAVIRANH